MSKSKNDIPVAGGYLRQTFHPVRTQYDAIYTIIDPQTGKPYTYGRLSEDLAQRKQDYPQLAALIDPVLSRITKKAELRPDSVFSVQRRGTTKEGAAEELQRACFSQLRAMMMLLFRPLYERNLAYGDVTVADFVLYQSEVLYMGELPETRTRLLGCLKSTILPEIGDRKLKDLDAAEQKKALRRMDRTLCREDAKASRRAYVRRAYQGLIQAIENSGWLGSAAGIRLADLLERSWERNTQILNSARPHCLDDVQRTELFRILRQPALLYEYFLVALLYSGMDAAEIAAACFGDFDVLKFNGQCCYTLIITRRVRKLHKRYSTLSATNQAFPIQKLRRVVLPPWAGDILMRRLEQLRSLGFSDDNIREMRLSSKAADSSFEGPDEINQRLEALLQEANIGSTTVTRTGREGNPYQATIRADVSLLQRDAKHLAELCGADLVMLHAMFGIAWTETDEQAYLDLLGDAYAVARYLRLRRWSPLSPAPLLDDGCLTGFSDAPARHILQVSNNSDHPTTLTLSANYAVRVYWKTQKERKLIMKRKPSPPKDFSYQGANFVLRYSWPSARRHTATPCRGYVDPLDPMTGKPLSKRQVYGKDSDEPVHYTVYGKDPQDIWDHHREEAASHLTALMVQRGLLGAEPAPDPATTAEIAILARNFAGTFFFLHRSEWGVTTMEEYRRQFDILMDELGDLRVGDLNDEVYRRLQETICRNALAGARKMESWTYGEEPPSSARKRMSILYELIQDLKQVEGVPIPTVPKRYNSKPSRQQQLLDIVDSARSLPVELLQNTLSSPSLLSQVKILADTGLRISEMIGLYFGSVQAISTSQGIMYYLTVTGQIDSSGKRTEITKTGASYRVVPLSSELGEFLMEQRQKMELRYGDLSLHLLCGCAKANGFSDDPRTVTAINNEVSNLVPALLRRPDFFKALTAKRAYLFDEQIQDKELRSMLTCHALRRNFCTWLYCSSGLDSTEIYQQMGHTYKPQPRRTAAGLTPEEVRCMCLRKHVSSTLYHPANPLSYPVKGSFHASEIPACSVELELNPGETIELTVEDTEPGTVTHVGGKSISVRSLHRDRQHNVIYRYNLLAADEITSGLKKCKLLA